MTQKKNFIIEIPDIADDNKVGRIVNNKELCSQMQKLDYLSNWAKRWQMPEIDADKCRVLNLEKKVDICKSKTR